jgi:Domain of unknown function (DUF397)
MSLNRDGLRAAGWRKARRSIGNGECVEVAPVVGNIAVRDSMNPEGPILQYSAVSWRSFLTAAKKGDFDAFRG